MAKINFNKFFSFDSYELPPSMKEIIFVKGTPYEMGVQYGKHCRNYIYRNFCIIAAEALQFFNEDELIARIDMLIKDMRDKTPEITQWWEGIAAGAGMTYEEIALVNLHLWLCNPAMSYSTQCSTIAATKSATVDHKTIIGVNGDVTFNMSGYGLTLVAFPDGGQSFLVNPTLAGQMGGNFALNENGVAITFDGGGLTEQSQQRIGYAEFISAMVHVISKAKSAKEANEIFKSLGVGGGWIFTFADKNKNIMVTEHTAILDRTRFPGDNGEQDYIHCANHYIHEDMRNFCGVDGNEDSWFRYDAERQLLEQELGRLDLTKMMNILGCKAIYSGGHWHENEIWEVAGSFCTPEMGAPDFRTGTRAIAVLEDCTAYILHGTSYVINSYMPGSKGKFFKIPVLGEMVSIVRQMESDAVMAVWSLSDKLYKCENITSDVMKVVDEAKAHVWIGKNILAKAILAENEESRKYFGLAASEFSYAYIKAQLI